MELTGSLAENAVSEPVNSVYLKAVSVKIPGGQRGSCVDGIMPCGFFWLMEVKMVRP